MIGLFILPMSSTLRVPEFTQCRLTKSQSEVLINSTNLLEETNGVEKNAPPLDKRCPGSRFITNFNLVPTILLTNLSSSRAETKVTATSGHWSKHASNRFAALVAPPLEEYALTIKIFINISGMLPIIGHLER